MSEKFDIIIVLPAMCLYLLFRSMLFRYVVMRISGHLENKTLIYHEEDCVTLIESMKPRLGLPVIMLSNLQRSRWSFPPFIQLCRGERNESWIISFFKAIGQQYPT